MLKLSPVRMPGSIWDEGGKSGIVQILISHDDKPARINSLQFVYVEKGELHHSKIHGEATGLKFNVVTFDYPSEFLTSVSGVFDGYGLRAIAFGTNKGIYGPFGKKDLGDAPKFSLANDSRTYDIFNYEFGTRSCFGGFHGSIEDSHVFAIGVYIKPLESLAELKPIESPPQDFTDYSGAHSIGIYVKLIGSGRIHETSSD